MAWVKKTLVTLQEKFPLGFILEAENIHVNASNQEQRQARYKFYQQNGLTDTGVITHNMGSSFHLLRSQPTITIDDYLRASKILNIPAASPFSFGMTILIINIILLWQALLVP